ncbi:MAG: DUF1501 domain-containing protein [Azospirillaceae bacterium]|nr:DUF1501 domain-containing protein [Azospirillaceae bacterium]
MDITRRTLLRSTAAAAALVPAGGLRTLAFAEGVSAAGSRDILVVLFLRGGCDVLHLLGPANDPNYIADRAPELRVLDNGDKAGISLDQPIGKGVDFRLHGEAAPLAELYRAGHLAIVHATGIGSATRSHFEAQDLIEAGYSGTETGARPDALTDNGWVARTLAAIGTTEPLSAVSVTNGVVNALHGFAPALAIPDLQHGLDLPGGPQATDVLQALYRGGDDPLRRAGTITVDGMNRVNGRLPRGPDGKIATYQPDPGANYDDGELTRGLQTVARLVKLDLGLQLACVDMGGWDTHENQAGRFAGLARQLSRNLLAFWNDMAPWHDRLTLVTVSEFGRRLRSNRSGGTDHGHGSLMMVLSGHARGGRMYGTWPGLATPDLDQGVDLAATTDYRTVLAEIMTARLGCGAALGHIFPGYRPHPALGLVSA